VSKSFAVIILGFLMANVGLASDMQRLEPISCSKMPAVTFLKKVQSTKDSSGQFSLVSPLAFRYAMCKTDHRDRYIANEVNWPVELTINGISYKAVLDRVEFHVDTNGKATLHLATIEDSRDEALRHTFTLTIDDSKQGSVEHFASYPRSPLNGMNRDRFSVSVERYREFDGRNE